MKLFRKQKDKVFSEYPCSDYLHNALKFLSDNEPNVAYEEICHALLRAGDKLSDKEKETFENIRNKRISVPPRGGNVAQKD